MVYSCSRKMISNKSKYKWVTDTSCNMDAPQKHYFEWKKVQKSTYCMCHLYKVQEQYKLQHMAVGIRNMADYVDESWLNIGTEDLCEMKIL